MRHRLAAFILLWLILGLACGGTTPTPAPPPPPAQPPATASSSSGYLLVADGSIHSDSEGSPKGLYVKGRLWTDRAARKRLSPEGDVQGEGELGSSGHPGWMELADGSFHGDETGRPPFPPYVRGFRGPDGKFRPSSRKVTY